MDKSEFNRRVNQDIQGMMGTLNRDDHMLLDGNNMVCKHCNTKQQLKMPTTFDDMDETFAKFMALHAHCEKPAKPFVESVMDIAKQAFTNAVNDGYQTGFDHGCDYLVNEAEYWVRSDKGTLAEFVKYMKDFKKD
jgi:hypothetical protein